MSSLNQSVFQQFACWQHRAACKLFCKKFESAISSPVRHVRSNVNNCNGGALVSKPHTLWCACLHWNRTLDSFLHTQSSFVHAKYSSMDCSNIGTWMTNYRIHCSFSQNIVWVSREHQLCAKNTHANHLNAEYCRRIVCWDGAKTDPIPVCCVAFTWIVPTQLLNEIHFTKSRSLCMLIIVFKCHRRRHETLQTRTNTQWDDWNSDVGFASDSETMECRPNVALLPLEIAEPYAGGTFDWQPIDADRAASIYANCH